MLNYDIYMVDLDGTPIDGVSSQTINSGTEVVRNIVDGQVAPVMGYVNTIVPVIPFETKKIGAMLTAFGANPLAGFPIKAADTATLYCRLMEELGSRSADGALKVLVNMGIVIPVSLNAGVDATGSMQVEIHTITDGTNAPIVTTPTQSLAGTPDMDEEFTVGPAKLNNVAVSGIQSVSVAFGITLAKTKDGGDGAGVVYPSSAYIQGVQPVITLVTRDVDLFDTYKEGVAIASSTLVQLAKRAKGGSIAGGSVHPQFTVAEGMIVATSIDGSPQQVSIDIYPSDDLSNPLMAYVLATLAT
jgi:hypothetical protein